VKNGEIIEQLRIQKAWCWLNDFREYAASIGSRYPAPSSQFNALANDFFTHYPNYKEYVWMADHEIKAMYVSTLVKVSDSDGAKMLEYKAHWDSYMGKLNMNAPGQASGFHASSLWVRAEAPRELIRSAVVTMVILLCLALCGMLVFTQSAVMSLFVIVATLTVMCGLAFFIVFVMGWTIGLLETISVVYFIGYAVTYSLHIAHSYASPEALQRTTEEVDEDDPNGLIRLRRTVFALRSIGAATFGSAVTTSLAALFLCFCTLSVFRKLGGMCLVVTLLSICTALCSLPAWLILAGPLQPGVCGNAHRLSSESVAAAAAASERFSWERRSVE